MRTLIRGLFAALLVVAPAAAQQNTDSQVQVNDNPYGQLPAAQLYVTPTGGTRTTLGAALGNTVPSTGGTFTGPVGFGANAATGSNFGITGGTIANATISNSTGGFTSLNVTGAGYQIGGVTVLDGSQNLTATGSFSSQIGSSITKSGALCNGSTDDTATINTYLATFTAGGLVYVPPGRMCLINSANLTIPQNVTIIGAGSPQSAAQAISLSGSTGFILSPSYTVSMGSGAQLRDIFIQRSGMIANPTSAQVITAVAQWGAERSIAVTIPANTGGVMLFDVFIEGFNTCFKASSGQFSVQWLSGDCYNGVEVMNAGDNHFLDNVRFEPYYALSTSATSGSWARPGVAFNFHDGNTGTILTRAFSYMYANAVVLNNIGITQIANSQFEWQAASGNGETGTLGLRMINSCPECSISNTDFNTFDTGVSVEVSNIVKFDGDIVTSPTVAGFYLAGGTGTGTTITATGTVAPGNTASETITSAAVTGSPLTIAYTAVPGDTTSSVAAGLARAVNANQALISAKFSAGYSGSVETTWWPSNASATVTTASTGGITTSTGTGSAIAGSGGQIASPQVAFSNVPNFILGNSTSNANGWNISNPYLAGAGSPLPTGWLTVPFSATGLSQSIILSGIPWSLVYNGAVTACGGGGMGGNVGTDVDGQLNEGAATAGCTLTFTTPFYKSPSCVVGTVAGNVPTSITVTTTSLVITNASGTGNKYAYHCAI